MSPKDAGAWFYPKLLPPATCGSVKHPASMVMPLPEGPFLAPVGVFWGSDSKSHPSPAVPELAPARQAYILSPINAGAWFHPKLLPPATCGSVKHPASMVMPLPEGPFLARVGVFWGSDPRSHPSPAVPELAPARWIYILSQKDAGAWFYPKLLPPATCGSVKHPASMVCQKALF